MEKHYGRPVFRGNLVNKEYLRRLQCVGNMSGFQDYMGPPPRGGPRFPGVPQFTPRPNWANPFGHTIRNLAHPPPPPPPPPPEPKKVPTPKKTAANTRKQYVKKPKAQAEPSTATPAGPQPKIRPRSRSAHTKEHTATPFPQSNFPLQQYPSQTTLYAPSPETAPSTTLPGEVNLESLRMLLDESPETILVKLRFEEIGFWEVTSRSKGYLDDEIVIHVILIAAKATQCRQYKENLETFLTNLSRSYLVRMRLPHCLKRQTTYRKHKDRFQLVLFDAFIGFFRACLEYVPSHFDKHLAPSLILARDAMHHQMVPGHKFNQQSVKELIKMISDRNIPDSCADFFKIDKYPTVPDSAQQETPPPPPPPTTTPAPLKQPSTVKPKAKMVNSAVRQMSIMPNMKDLADAGSGLLSSFQNLRLDSRFSDLEEYLEVHFRFLRLELLAPLKEVITKRKSAMEISKLMPIVADGHEMAVPHAYPGTVISSLELTSFGVLCILKVKMEHMKDINWSSSRNFLTGSLLCLSHNEFNTGFWASVVQRDVAQLKKGILRVWIIQPEKCFNHLMKEREYVMIENSKHFEAVEKILVGLQSQTELWKPLENSILNANFNSGISAIFFEGQRAIKYHFRPAFPAVNWSTIPGMGWVEIKGMSTWAFRDKLNLGEAQYAAITSALTRQVTVINGASGTGKKFVASKIGQILVHNANLEGSTCQGPLVFICESASALDDFICGMRKSNITEIIRIGGQCAEDSDLKNCNFYEIKAAKKVRQGNVKKKDSVARREAKSHAAKLANLMKTINRCQSGILGERISLIFGNDLQHHENSQRALCHWLQEGTPRLPVSNRPVTPTKPDSSTSLDNLENVEESLRSLHEELTRFEPYIKLNFDKDDPEEPDDIESWNSIKGLLNQQMASEDMMTPEEEIKTGSIWNLSPTDRWRLYRKRVKDLENISETCLKEHLVSFTKCLDQLRELKIQSQAAFLSSYKVVAFTVTGAVKFLKALRAMKPSVVLVQEAGCVPEELLVSILPDKCQQLTLIGDLAQQWPRLSQSKSLFERLASQKTFPTCQLNVQYSMTSSLMNFLNVKRSNDLVKAHPSVVTLRSVTGVEKDLFFLAHSNKDEVDEEERNSFEAEYAVALCRHLFKQGYNEKRISILTTTFGQLMEVHREMEGGTDKVNISHVDHYQGQRSDIVIVSMVKSGQEEGDMSIAEKRFQLAFSGAKIGIFCFVNVNYLSKNTALWSQFLPYLVREGLIGNTFRIKCSNHPEIISDIHSPQEFQTKSPNGGCSLKCIKKMPCGHLCNLSCHFYDKHHVETAKSCTEICMKKICLSGHLCGRLCHEECKSCQKTLIVKLPSCGHDVFVKCNDNNLQLKCHQPCAKMPFECEHSCPNKCWEECSKQCTKNRVVAGKCGHVVTVLCMYANQPDVVTSMCDEKCTAVLPCGHKCTGTCGKCQQGTWHQICQEKCQSIIPLCGHRCEAPCHQKCPPCRKPCEMKCRHGQCKKLCGFQCDPCEEPCGVSCAHSKCTKKCGEPCNSDPCNVPCMKLTVACQHPCVGLCGETCPPNCGFCARGPEYVNAFGTENSFARYVYLQDCGHCLEVSGMDKWMANPESSCTFQMHKLCPACQEPITHSVRYHSILNRAKENIINKKLMTFGNPILLDSEKASLVRRITIHQSLFPDITSKVLSVLSVEISQFQLTFIHAVVELVSEMNSTISGIQLSLNQNQANEITEKIMSMQKQMTSLMHVGQVNGVNVVNLGSSAQLDNLKQEMARLYCTKWLFESVKNKSIDSISEKAKPLFQHTILALTSCNCFTPEVEVVVKKAINLIKQLERPFLSYLIKESEMLEVLYQLKQLN